LRTRRSCSAQQLDLHGQRQVGHLIEQQRAAMSGLKKPPRSASAPVKAPFTWPKNSASISVSGIAPQFTAMNAPSAR
jgi:hypothetical protein